MNTPKQVNPHQNNKDNKDAFKQLNPHRNSKESKDASREFNTHLVNKISEVLKESGMTYKELGAELGINQSTFGKYFTYDSKIPCDVLRAIAIKLGVSTDFLLGLTLSESNRSFYSDLLAGISFSDSAADAMVSFGSEKFLLLDNLLKTGIQYEILDIFNTYKEEVLSNFLAYASTDWYRALAESIQSGIEELSDLTVHPDSVSEMNRYLETILDIPFGPKHEIAHASYTLFLHSRATKEFYQKQIKKLRYEACCKLVELLSDYGDSYLRNFTNKELNDSLEHKLRELFDYNTQLAERVQELQEHIDRPPIDKLRENFYPSL